MMFRGSEPVRGASVVSWIPTDGSFYRPDKPLKSPLFGESIPVLIHTDGREIQPEQLDSLSRFLEIPADRRDLLTRPLFEDYWAIREAVGEGPDIDSPDLVWRYVRWTTILVPLQGPSGNRYIFVIGEPEWEPEHGVELLFCNERLVRVDRAQGAFLGRFWERVEGRGV
jgi:hypothetical protein